MNIAKNLVWIALAALVAGSSVQGLWATTEDLQSIGSLSPQEQAAALNRFFDRARTIGASGAVVAPREDSLFKTAAFRQPGTQERMLKELDFIESAFKAGYAPYEWKEQFLGWDFDGELARARAKIQANPNMSFSEYHQILQHVIFSAKDYHVSIYFAASEAATLPLAVQQVNGKFFIAWIDRKKLSEKTFPFKVGDELIKFDGRDPADVVKQIQEDAGNTDTDRAIATMRLTSRSARALLSVPSGPVTIEVKPKSAKPGDKPVKYELVWDYTPESVTDQPGLVRRTSADIDDLGEHWMPFKWMANMTAGVDDKEKDKSSQDKPNPFGLGVRESLLPSLGTKLPGTESDDKNPFFAYIYRTPKHVIGYVRIPSYTPKDTDKALEEFGKIIKAFEPSTDALVIDQLNNPGGSVFYLYTLASMLSDHALTAPRHRIAITQEDVAEAGRTIHKIETLVRNDEEAKKVFGPTFDGYPMSYEFSRYLIDFSRFIIGEWNAGRTLTNPIYLYGADHINPSQVANYTKPILILTNELDFSGGDFFPTIMQDNRRATIFGMRTSGAGGFIRNHEVPNSVGVESFSVTGSIADRNPSHRPIENLGVTPDVGYKITEEDLKDGYKGYIKAVNEAVEKLIGS